MKNKIIAVYLCIALSLSTLTGCGNSDIEADAPIVETNNSDTFDEDKEEDSDNQQNKDENSHIPKDNEEKNNNSQQGNEEENLDNFQSDNEESNDNQQIDEEKNDISQQDNNETAASQSNDSLQSDYDLEGTVESIGNNSVVINKTFHPSSTTAVVYGDSDKVLLTVNFSESTKFEVWTVRNGGLNGDDDTDIQEGSFSDIKENASIKLTGSYEENNFCAEKVIIYEFV